MFKVGGFPEFLPREQEIFDKILGIIEKNYINFNYDHIYTPAVERNEILLAKGGEEVSKQIFGLYGLAQGCEKDKKDYSLHFDLTVPFARYILDYESKLTFPFKRYQIQPVWRGERQQKGRFREFRQADIDVIWKTEDDKLNKYIWYDIEVISILIYTLQKIFTNFNVGNKLILRLNNKKIIKGFLNYFDKIGLNVNIKQGFVSILDKFHKIGQEKVEQEIKKLIISNGFSERVADKLIEIFSNSEKLEKEMRLANNELYFEGEEELKIIISGISEFLNKFGIEDKIKIFKDTTIVRGLDYYTGVVFETFIEDVESLGSICSGGRYDNLTGYIDSKKNYFSGVGGSIGVNRLFDWLKKSIEHNKYIKDKILIINFGYGEIFAKNFEIMKNLIKEGKKVEIYPYPDKIKKQFKYADKKGFNYVIIMGEDEIKKGIYKIKDLEKGEEVEVNFKDNINN